MDTDAYQNRHGNPPTDRNAVSDRNSHPDADGDTFPPGKPNGNTHTNGIPDTDKY